MSTTVDLTIEEILLIEDKVSLNLMISDGVTDLLLRLGSALIKLSELEETSIPVGFDEEDAWTVITNVSINETVGGKPVGLSIKKKMYGILLKYQTDRFSGEIKKVNIDAGSKDKRKNKNHITA